MPPVEIITRVARIAAATERAIGAVLGKPKAKVVEFPERGAIDAIFREARKAGVR